MRRKPGRASFGWRRFRAGVLVRLSLVICLLLQLFDVGHFVIVRHDICAEHGEAVHVAAPAQASIRASMHEHGGAAVAGNQADAEEHDHCPLTPHRARQADVAAAPQLGLIEAHVSALPPPLLPPVALPAGTLRLLAPKTSPPV